MIEKWAGLFARGFAMGIAEIIPGVSGGTIAFITGIYDELLRSLAGFSHRSVGMLWRQGAAAFWREHNLSFLLVLGLGMLSAVLVCARLVRALLELVPAVRLGVFLRSDRGLGRQHRSACAIALARDELRSWARSPVGSSAR